MPEIVQVILLAAVQGLTEFLPVSSSGHLVLMQHLFGSQTGDLLFDVVLHGGTLFSIVVVYRRELGQLLRLDAAARGYVLAIVVGTVPAVLVGVLLGTIVEELFQSADTAAVGLLVTAGLLFSTRLAGDTGTVGADRWRPQSIDWRHAFVIGCAQALAICPGISRSGATITAGLWLGLPRDEAARFSFLLSLPAVAGALLLELAGGDLTARTGTAGLVLGAAVAFAFGLLAIRWTALAVVQRHFWKFAPYCLVLGTVVLLLA
jgi:undecaprenyl-diphosphatase